jgi:hypothetical protein
MMVIGLSRPAVAALHRKDLDTDYLRRWADDLRVREALERVLREIG